MVDEVKPWCSTKVDENGWYVKNKWGYCDPECPCVSNEWYYGGTECPIKESEEGESQLELAYLVIQ